MKVYELIQALCQCEPDCDVKVNFNASMTFDCPHCEKSFDDNIAGITSIDDTDYRGRVKEFYIEIRY